MLVLKKALTKQLKLEKTRCNVIAELGGQNSEKKNLLLYKTMTRITSRKHSL